MLNEKFAVIDTETTWRNELMSVGAVIAGSADFAPAHRKYYILLPNKTHGGMFSGALYIRGVKPDIEGARETVITDLRRFLTENNVRRIFAYNAMFDHGQLPELADLEWFDIMKLAAYRQFNEKISPNADCFSTGRLRRGFGVESVFRMLSGNDTYRETHNALFDALDELAIMKMLGHSLPAYDRAKIN